MKKIDVLNYYAQLNDESLNSLGGVKFLYALEKNKRALFTEAKDIEASRELHPDTKIKNQKLQEIQEKKLSSEELKEAIQKLDADYPIEAFNKEKFEEWKATLDDEVDTQIYKVSFNNLPENITKKSLDCISFMVDFEE